jgi:hypothetical protein
VPRPRVSGLLPFGLVLALAWTPALASVAPVVSRNWAGYVAGGRGQLRFKTVSASWRQPSLSCAPGSPASFGIWVGLGGYKRTSQAVEQIGTDLDCGPSGRVTSGAWYELVPRPARPIRMEISPGDRLRASVRVAGHRAWLTLTDVTRHESFHKLAEVPAPDVSSADWIVEAPSGCAGQGNCAQLPLADFGTARFTHARATTLGGLSGSAVSRTWITTGVLMLPDPTPYDPNGTGYAATPGPLSSDGSSFVVRWLSSGFRYLGRVAGAGRHRRLAPGGARR